MNKPIILDPHRSFTLTQKPIRNKIISNATICFNGYTLDGQALWDTGATNTCISTSVVEKLHLIATGEGTIKTPSGSDKRGTYLVDIILPNNVTVPQVMVFDTEIGNQGLDMLIGMDIISQGDFAISNYQGTTMFSFRYPSVKHTNYVQETNVSNMYAIAGTHGQGKRKRK